MHRKGSLWCLAAVLGVVCLMLLLAAPTASAGLKNSRHHNNTGTTKYDLHYKFSAPVTVQTSWTRIVNGSGHTVREWPPSGTVNPPLGTPTSDIEWGGSIPQDSVAHCETVAVCVDWDGRATLDSVWWTPAPVEPIPDFSLILIFIHYPDCHWRIIIVVDNASGDIIQIVDLEWGFVDKYVSMDNLRNSYLDSLDIDWTSEGNVVLAPGEEDTIETFQEVASGASYSWPYLVARAQVKFDGAPGDPPTETIYEFCAAWQTFVEMASLDAAGRSDRIDVAWSTETELDNAGFNVYRSVSTTGERFKVSRDMIAAQGDEVKGGAYQFTDTDVMPGITYYYWVEDVDLNGHATIHGPVTAQVRDIVAKPVRLMLAQNRPNPFTATTEIEYGLPAAGEVNLAIFNLMGQRVKTLATGSQPAGYNVVHWDGTNDAGVPVSGGVYYCSLVAADQTRITKMVYLK